MDLVLREAGLPTETNGSSGRSWFYHRMHGTYIFPKGSMYIQVWKICLHLP